MTYSSAISFLYELRRFGTKPGLDTCRRLAERAGRPQEALRFIHVAGTNGKGSVCAMLEAIYRQAGFKVGLFTSPHLVAFGERIQVNRQLLSQEQLVGNLESLMPLLIESPAQEHPTFFEVVTVLALRHFAAARCDLVIWETGMGGRLDATNIVMPEAAVITNVGLDHQAWLGPGLAEIAREKGGIIKPGLPVVSAAQGPSRALLADIARERGAPVRWVEESDVMRPELSPDRVALAGTHQRWNAATALAVVEVLRKAWPVSASQAAQGLAGTEWPGRWQECRGPSGGRMILDGAHNAEGMRALSELWRQRFPESRPAVVLGILEDKDWQGMCPLAAGLAGRVAVVPVASLRSARPEILARACRESAPELDVTVYESCDAALRALRQEPLVLVTGSLYLVGEALAVLDAPSGRISEVRLNETLAGAPSTSTKLPLP